MERTAPWWQNSVTSAFFSLGDHMFTVPRAVPWKMIALCGFCAKDVGQPKDVCSDATLVPVDTSR